MSGCGDVKEAETPYLTKFDVDDVEPAKVLHRHSGSEERHVATRLSLYREAECGEIIQGTTFAKENIISAENGFVTAVTKAYDGHHHLVLRPDDIWQTIMTQFSFYLNASAEKLRSKFINFEKKKNLVVVSAEMGQ